MTEEFDLIQIVTTSVLQELPDADYEATGLTDGAPAAEFLAALRESIQQ
jgi:hypothetical protein